MVGDTWVVPQVVDAFFALIHIFKNLPTQNLPINLPTVVHVFGGFTCRAITIVKNLPILPIPM